VARTTLLLAQSVWLLDIWDRLTRVQAMRFKQAAKFRADVLTTLTLHNAR